MLFTFEKFSICSILITTTKNLNNLSDLSFNYSRAPLLSCGAPEIESRFFTDSFLFFLTVNVSISDEYHAPRATTTEFAVCVSKLLQMFVLCFHLITSHRHAYTGGAGGNDGCCY